MARKEIGDLISLDSSQQKKLDKENKKLKKKIKEGKVPLKGEKKPKPRTPAHIFRNRGLIYISHLPHGFYEEEMQGYFSQFGKVTNVKVCRSSKTGRSKGYGYIEFFNQEVARIAAESMNNYLMFKKRVVTEYVAPEKRPPYLFGRGTNHEVPSKPSVVLRRERQFEANLNLSKEKYDERLKKRMTRLGKKLNKLKRYGVETEFLPVDVGEATKAKLLSRVAMKPRRNRKIRNEPGKFVKVKKELNETSLLGKSLESVRTLLDLSTAAENEPVISPLKVDKSTETKKTPKTITKKKKKNILSTLDSNTVKRIARELVRKKGPSLLVPRKPVAKSTPKRKNQK